MERRRIVAGTGTEDSSFRALFFRQFFVSLDHSAKGGIFGVLLDGRRVDDAMGGKYRLGAALL